MGEGLVSGVEVAGAGVTSGVTAGVAAGVVAGVTSGVGSAPPPDGLQAPGLEGFWPSRTKSVESPHFTGLTSGGRSN